MRAVLLGLLGAATICGVTFFNDMVMRGTFLVGNFLPMSVFGTLILFLLLVNPLLGRVSARLCLSARELGIIICLTLFACFIPGRGLMHQFTTFLMLPHHRLRTDPGWQGDSPRVTVDQVKSWGQLVAGLRAAGTGSAPAPDAGSPARRAWDRLTEADRQALISLAPDATPEVALQNHILEAINQTLADPALPHAESVWHLPLAPHVRNSLQSNGGQIDPLDLPALNRGILEAALAGAIAPRSPGVLEHVPPRLLADTGPNSTLVVDGFVNGLAEGEQKISLRQVPWYAWLRTLLFWAPLILTLSIATIGLALVLHRQWTAHENLPYPTVEFARALLPEEGQRLSETLRNRLFWIGAGVVLLIHMNNYACSWWPEKLIPVRIQYNFWPFVDYFPIFRKGDVGLAWTLFNPTIYFTVVGFAYFLPTDISLSLGLASYLFALVAGILTGYGVMIGTGRFLEPSIYTFLYAGSYCSMFLVLIYSGRRYYGTVFRRGLGLRAPDPAEPHAVWGARAFLVCVLLAVAQLVAVGLHPVLSVAYLTGLFVIVVVASRLLAEAGVFYLHPYFFPCVLVWGVLGARAIGPDQLLIMGMLSSVLLIDPRETLMPFVVSGLQLADKVRAKVGTTAAWGGAAIAIGLAIAIPVTLYLQYQHGAIRTGDGWTTGGPPTFAFNASSTLRKTLAAQGALDQAMAPVTTAGLITKAAPLYPCLGAFAITFGLVLLFAFLRHRFAGWPLHPLMFLVLSTWQSRVLAFSFLLGWFIKACIAKYGGAAGYQRLKPLMTGLIAGEMLAGVIPMIIGAIYYFATGVPPKVFAIFR